MLLKDSACFLWSETFCEISKKWNKQITKVLDFPWNFPFYKFDQFCSYKTQLSFFWSQVFCLTLQWKKDLSVKIPDGSCCPLLNRWMRFHLIKIKLFLRFTFRFGIPDFFYHIQDTRQTICKGFRFSLYLFSKQIHAISIN